MKKIVKWILISISILVFLVILLGAIAVWVVFTPDRLTPIVRKQAANYLTCKSEIGEVELTFFSTFPSFGLKVSNLTLVNPVKGATSDTLISADYIVGVVDVGAWWKRNEIVVNEVLLENSKINAFVDSLGKTNFDIVKGDSVPEKPDTSKSKPLGLIDIKNMAFNNVTLTYVDLQNKLQAAVRNLTAQFSGSVYPDSLESRIIVDNVNVSFSYGKDKYLDSMSLSCDIPLKLIISKQLIYLNNASVSVNNMELKLNGSIENDTINKKLLTNITYNVDSWSIASIMALVPPSFQSYLKDIQIAGDISTNGSLQGAYNDSVMPLMDISLQLNNVTMKYKGFPLPLHDVNGNFVFHSDLKTDSLSYFLIKDFRAKTPQSSFSTRGMVKSLFSDISVNLKTDASLILEEFKPLIPDSLKLSIKGNVKGKINSVFKMSQIEKMLLDKMNISGSIALSNFETVFDTIQLKTNNTNIEFAIPNPNLNSNNTSYFWTKISSDSLETIMPKIFAGLQNLQLVVETSNFMDTTKVPNVRSNFSMDSLIAQMDTIQANISSPSGNISMVSQKGSKAMPDIVVNYKSGSMQSLMGRNKFTLNSINLNADVKNDPSQKEIFQQWIANGFLDLNNANISLTSMPYPIEIPSIKLQFDPENFVIQESRMKIDKSDFSLSGKLSNIFSYFKKDSLLRGDFNFVSDNTDLLQLMALTNGLGVTDTLSTKTNEAAAEATGPYMVPKGIDFILRTNISKATFGIDTISNIHGDVTIKDGILVLDDLYLTTPGAKIQLTSMYRTPRKNHIYLGLDYHMMDIEIANLMNMIPGIDTMMPMLKSFKGKGEFHIAVETFLDSLYNVKISTIRGASSIQGKDLVLMDGPTFTELSKLLRFNKKTENKIDSLSVEFTIFKNEIDIYPFLIGIDKYKAVVSGRHNLNMTFDYNVSLVESPLPFKLGAEVKGSIDNLKYRLAKPKYDVLYKPSSRNIVEDKQIQLRKIIRDALVKKVNEQNKNDQNKNVPNI